MPSLRLNLMKIHYYTITTNSFYQYTSLMIKSFIKYSPNNKIYVLTVDNIENKIEHPSITYLSCQPIIDKYVSNNIDLQSKMTLKLCCWWIKSRCVDFQDLMDTEYITYIDSDILFFKDISEYINNTIFNHSDTLFYAANDGRKISTPPLINSGFYFSNINKYPFIDLMNSWNDMMLNLLPKRMSFRRTNKLLFKYFDQTTLKNLLSTDKYKNYQALDPNIIGYRRYSSNLVLAHYIKTHKYRMASDYTRFIDPL